MDNKVAILPMTMQCHQMLQARRQVGLSLYCGS